ncbi:MAG TPA: hypothetical protein VLA69_09655 [Gaiellaceae bacterium]|nr:hypothetical protein [Gaiellaceae bacterium]
MRPLAHVLVAALCALAAAGCGSGSSDGQAASPAAGPTEVESPSAVPARERAPVIAGRSLDGEPLSLAGYRGRPVLVNVWSSW